MIINGVELEFDLYDLETAKRMDKAIDAVKSVAINKKTYADRIRSECKAAFVFFDALFGDGTAKKVFGDELNLKKCTDAMALIYEERTRQEQEYSSAVNRYLPNRAERRAKR